MAKRKDQAFKLQYFSSASDKNYFVRAKYFAQRCTKNNFMSQYLGVAFTSDERQGEELNVRFGQASAVMRASHHFVVLKHKLSRKAKTSLFKSMFVPILNNVVMNLG